MPYIQNMGEALAAADVVVSRAGASSIAEIAALAVPSVLVPYPLATGDHQTTNAHYLVDAKAATLVPDDRLDDGLLADALLPLLDEAERRDAMREAARSLGQDRAAKVLADEVEAAVREYGIVSHPKYGNIYAFEVDGFGNQLMMDDANIPSLLALPYITDVGITDSIYQNTRRFVLSEDNPYYFKGLSAEGIGGPHIGPDYIWPMSIVMRAMTSSDDDEIASCLRWLQQTDAGTGFMHESFHKDNPGKFTRKWFAWANTLFGELMLKVLDEHQQVLKK
jgi:meiotically up-regulated gene 157 (Mug157) protein